MPILLEPDFAGPSAGKQETSPPPRPSPGGALLALAAILLAIVAWRHAPVFARSPDGSSIDDTILPQVMFKLSILILGSFLFTFALLPSLVAPTRWLRRRWRNPCTYAALASLCAFQWAFTLHAGRWQFGGFDQSVLLQVGWRQVLGQRPYVDFLVSTPPAFNLGIAAAFRVFGVTWDANLYLTAIFTCATFLWIYRLLTRLSLGRLASMATAFAIECAAMLTLSYWWYNNITLILAAILFLSTLLVASRSRSVPAQLSYVLSLALASLSKPNIAGVAMLGCIAMLLIVSDRRLQAVLLTLGAATLAIAVLLLNHVSIQGLLRAYRSVAGERGFGAVGFSQMNPYEQGSSLCWLLLLSLPLLAVLRGIKQRLRQRDWQGAGFSLFFLLAPAIAAYGIRTNGELWQVDCTVLLAAGAVVAFGMKLTPPMLARSYIALLVSLTAANLFLGAQRLRVYDIGPHTFFEWQDNRNRIDSGVLKNMQVSSTMIAVERQVSLVLQQDPGPYYFGPRLDFNNAVFKLPMTEHLPAWWHPGTAFARADVPRLIQLWQERQFQTLIFLKGDSKNDYLYYPPEFLDVIRRDYVADERYSSLTVYRRRAELSPQP